MGAVVQISKLAQLRAKTDRDLLRILEADLERGLALAHVAATPQSRFYASAETIYARSKELLPLTPEVEDRLRELRMALDLVAGSVEEQTVCL